MKTQRTLKQYVSLFLIAVSSFGASGAFAEVNGQIPVPVKHIYVPKGFDDNDATEVVVTGELPSLCYYSPQAVVRKEGTKVFVSVLAYVSKATECEMMIVPFMLTVHLGVLSVGQYSIEVNPGTTTQKNATLNIAPALSDQVDDHIYANVETVTRVQGSRTVQLHGYNPSDCYVLDRAQILSNGSDTYAVLPIMKKVHSACPMKMVPFVYSVQIPTGLAEDELLVHVRGMKGTAVNYLFLQESEKE